MGPMNRCRRKAIRGPGFVLKRRHSVRCSQTSLRESGLLGPVTPAPPTLPGSGGGLTPVIHRPPPAPDSGATQAGFLVPLGQSWQFLSQ